MNLFCIVTKPSLYAFISCRNGIRNKPRTLFRCHYRRLDGIDHKSVGRHTSALGFSSSKPLDILR